MIVTIRHLGRSESFYCDKIENVGDKLLFYNGTWVVEEYDLAHLIVSTKIEISRQVTPSPSTCG